MQEKNGKENGAVVLTGATRGLGRAMAMEFAAAGKRVFGCGTNKSALDFMRKEMGSEHHFAAVDVSVYSEVEAWSREVLRESEPPELLINNAGLINANAALWEVPPDEFSRVIDVNIKGVYHVIRAFLPPMVERNRGVIVNFSSGWGRSVSPEVAPYCTTKWAIEGLSRALAAELPNGMAAVALNPGVIHTEMLESCFGRSAASHIKPDAWARKAVPMLLGIGPSDNGTPLTV